MGRPLLWIERADGLEALAASLGDGPLGLDTEADSLHRYRERVCLVQMSDGGRDALLDALALPSLDPLRPLLEDPERRKILHGADYDVRMLHRDHRIDLRGIFDTMIAARLVGESPFGLAALLARHFGVELDKRHQRADWARRPLPPEMAEYAAADTRHLRDLAELLAERLRTLGRTAWAEEEFRRIETGRFEAVPDPDPWRRMKGVGGLDRRGLAHLRAAWGWREGRAETLDRPPFRVASNDLLLEIARRRTVSRRELAALPGAPRSWMEGRGGIGALADALAGTAALEASDLPEPVKLERPARDPAFEKRVAALKSRRDALARGLGIEGPVLASRATLEGIQRAIDEGRDPASVPDVRLWQREVLGV